MPWAGSSAEFIEYANEDFYYYLKMSAVSFRNYLREWTGENGVNGGLLGNFSSIVMQNRRALAGGIKGVHLS